MNRQQRRKQSRQDKATVIFWEQVDEHYESVVKKHHPNATKDEFIDDTKEMLHIHTQFEVLNILKTGIVVPPSRGISIEEAQDIIDRCDPDTVMTNLGDEDE